MIDHTADCEAGKPDDDCPGCDEAARRQMDDVAAQRDGYPGRVAVQSYPTPIPVTESLPPALEWVLAFDGTWGTARYHANRPKDWPYYEAGETEWESDYDGQPAEVTHWMPLPEDPT